MRARKLPPTLMGRSTLGIRNDQIPSEFCALTSATFEGEHHRYRSVPMVNISTCRLEGD
jgi:hypothetical protein